MEVMMKNTGERRGSPINGAGQSVWKQRFFDPFFKVNIGSCLFSKLEKKSPKDL